MKPSAVISKKPVLQKKKNHRDPPSDTEESDFETVCSDDEEDDTETLGSKDTDDNEEDDEEEDTEDSNDEEESESEDETEEDIKKKKSNKTKSQNVQSSRSSSIKNKPAVKSGKLRKHHETSSEEEDSSDDEEDDDDKDTKHKKNKEGKDSKKTVSQTSAVKNKKQKFIIFNIGAAAASRKHGNNDEEDDEDDEYDEEDDDDFLDIQENEENEIYQPEEEEIFMKENYECIDDPTTTTKKSGKKTAGNLDGGSSKKNTIVSAEAATITSAITKAVETIEDKYKQLVETKKTLVQELKRRPNKIYEKALKQCNGDIEKLVRKGKKENLKTYHDLLKQERKKMNEYEYFRKKLSNKEQTNIIKDLDKIYDNVYHKKPYRFIILESKISYQLKSIALQKIAQLNGMCPEDGEYNKIKCWIDTFMKIPFGIYKNISVNIAKDGLEVCNQYMNDAQKTLDDCVYGLEESKLQIMQMLGNWLTNPSASGTTIAIKGSPGTGKTSLIKDGISKILGREFVFIPLGGAGDGSFLEGHSYTYEGSMWGKIVQSIIECKCMNPVFYFDELDKVSETPRGEEIIGILTHLTDTTQNMQFHDKYFAEINEFDLSKCLFIFSYNDESKINPILLNRMYVINTKGYNNDEKVIIAKKYILPKISKQVGFADDDVVFTDEVLRAILSNEQFCRKEDGVRNFKRCLEIIFTKLNLYRVMKPDCEFFKIHKDIPSNITFPHEVSNKDLDILIKKNEALNPSLLSMYV